jgi:hypothetical protein
MITPEITCHANISFNNRRSGLFGCGAVNQVASGSCFQFVRTICGSFSGVMFVYSATRLIRSILALSACRVSDVLSAKFAYRVTFDETSSDEGDFAFLQPDGYSRDQTRGAMKVASYACPPPNCLNTTLFISLLLYRGRALFHYIFFLKKKRSEIGVQVSLRTAGCKFEVFTPRSGCNAMSVAGACTKFAPGVENAKNAGSAPAQTNQHVHTRPRLLPFVDHSRSAQP